MLNPDVDSVAVTLAPIPLAAIAAGVFFVWQAFRQLRRRRKAEDLATSRARSLAFGPVELNGRVAPAGDILDPVYNEPSAYYRLSIQNLVITWKKNFFATEWRTLARQESDHAPFWLTDATGQTLVWAAGAEYRVTGAKVFTCGFFGSLGRETRELAFLRRATCHRIFLRPRRWILHSLGRDRSVYVLGEAVPPSTVHAENEAQRGLLRTAAAQDKGRVVVRGIGDFLIADSEKRVAESRAGIVIRTGAGFLLIGLGLAALVIFFL
jgi:hypothetical protein